MYRQTNIRANGITVMLHGLGGDTGVLLVMLYVQRGPMITQSKPRSGS